MPNGDTPRRMPARLGRAEKVATMIGYIRREPWTPADDLAGMLDVSASKIREWLWVLDGAGVIKRRRDLRTGVMVVALRTDREPSGVSLG